MLSHLFAQSDAQEGSPDVLADEREQLPVLLGEALGLVVGMHREHTERAALRTQWHAEPVDPIGVGVDRAARDEVIVHLRRGMKRKSGVEHVRREASAEPGVSEWFPRRSARRSPRRPRPRST